MSYKISYIACNFMVIGNISYIARNFMVISNKISYIACNFMVIGNISYIACNFMVIGKISYIACNFMVIGKNNLKTMKVLFSLNMLHKRELETRSHQCLVASPHKKSIFITIIFTE